MLPLSVGHIDWVRDLLCYSQRMGQCFPGEIYFSEGISYAPPYLTRTDALFILYWLFVVEEEAIL